MPEDTKRSEPPTYFANVVTLTMDTDQLVMELRQFLRPHRETFEEPKQEGMIFYVAPPTPKEIVSSEPVARVVLTFAAVRFLKRYLDAAFSQIEAKRVARE